jgi:hypothetical protein
VEPASSICAELEVNQCVVQQWLSRHHVPFLGHSGRPGLFFLGLGSDVRQEEGPGW